MIKTLQEQITDRIAELDLKEEFELSNAFDSLEYLKNEYAYYLSYTGDEALTFKDWYDIQKQNRLWGSVSTTDIDFWINDIENLNSTDILTSDYELFDKYFNIALTNI